MKKRKLRIDKSYCECKDNSSLPKIAVIISISTIIITALFLLFAKEWAGLLVPIILSLSIMGIILGYYTTKNGANKSH